MQEEVTRKTVALAIKTAKLDARLLQAALRKLLQQYQKHRDAPHHGKQTLSSTKQSILILRFVMDMTDNEVGVVLGMSRCAVQRHRAKAFQKMRDKLNTLLPKGGKHNE